MKDAKISNLKNPLLERESLRKQLDLAQQLNQIQLRQNGHDQNLESRIESMELAFRMQSEAPEVMDLSKETEETLRLYGIDEPHTEPFGRSCLLARRLSESGVRFVQTSHAYWDQHSELKEKHSELAKEVDRPIAGLLTDLKRRGLLDETLVIWGAEFGRTPTAQGNNGRDHNPHAFTYWFAGAGVKPGMSHGESDEFGFYSSVDRVHVHDFHATLLHILGIDHERLTYHYGGRDFRLTDVHGNVVHRILS
jgi:membrane-anchored protein YejM (alkaline phosphatase superfamily)